MLREITGSFFFGLAAAVAAELTVTADRPDARYKPGEKAVFKVVCRMPFASSTGTTGQK